MTTVQQDSIPLQQQRRTHTLNVRVTAAFRLRVKRAVADQDTTIQEFCERAIENELSLARGQEG